MGISDRANGETLQPWVQHLEPGLSLLQRRVKSGLVATLQRSKINCLNRGIELLLAFGLAIGVSGNQWTSRKYFHAQKRRIGPAGRWIHRELALLQPGL